tara:strand:+ start:310 stop:468 length:159 start_codon:yes stop_codon:yes gene_type:complete
MEEALRQLNRPLIDIDKMLEPFPLKEPQDEYTWNLLNQNKEDENIPAKKQTK